MIIQLVTWFLVALVAIPLSIAFQQATSRCFSRPLVKLDLDFHIIQGLAVLGGLLLWLNLFFPISIALQLIMLASSLVLLWIFKSQIPEIQFNKVAIGVAILLAAVLLAIASRSIYYYDTELYHLQAIFWRRLYPQVPGIVNLHGRLAFNSSSLTLNTFFSYADTFGLNSFLFFILWIRLFKEFFSSQTLNTKNAFFSVSVFVLIYFSFVYHGVNAPSPDSLLAIFICYLFIYFQTFKPKANQPEQWLFPLTVVMFLPTLKLSAVLMPLFAVYALLKNRTFFKELATLFLLFLLPFLIGNYIASGYPLYPSSAFAYWTPDWKIPLASVKEMQIAIESFAKSPALNPILASQMSLIEWLPIWFRTITTGQRGLFVLQLVILGLFIVRFKKMTELARVCHAILFINLFLWFFSAPDFRFAAGIVAANIALMLSSFFSGTRLDFELNARAKHAILIVALALVTFKNFDRVTEQLNKKLVFPLGVSEFAYHEVQVGSFQIKIPTDGDRCGRLTVPCTPVVTLGLSARGPTLKDGFKIAL